MKLMGVVVTEPLSAASRSCSTVAHRRHNKQERVQRHPRRLQGCRFQSTMAQC